MSVIDDVRAFNDAFERALADQDADALTALYADDARLMLAGQPMLHGQPAIVAVMRAWVEEGPVTLRFETEEVMADGELVIDIGHIVAAGGRTKYVVVHRRQPDGSLRIVVDAASGDGPATA